MTNLKPKVYYKNISSEEAELLKLRNDEKGFYSRSTKIQASVNKHIEVREGYSCIKGIIYKIYSPNTPKIYVGSSTKTIKTLVSQSRGQVRANPNLLEVAKHGGAEIKLRPVVGEKRRVSAALLLGQNIGLGGELGVRRHRPGLGQNLAALNILALGAA